MDIEKLSQNPDHCRELFETVTGVEIGSSEYRSDLKFLILHEFKPAHYDEYEPMIAVFVNAENHIVVVKEAGTLPFYVLAAAEVLRRLGYE